MDSCDSVPDSRSGPPHRAFFLLSPLPLPLSLSCLPPLSLLSIPLWTMLGAPVAPINQLSNRPLRCTMHGAGHCGGCRDDHNLCLSLMNLHLS